MKKYDPPTMPFRWGWDWQWFGWRRCLWLAVLIDVGTPLVGVVFFGLMVSYGKNQLDETQTFTN